jgi:hypothetical protein
MTLWANGDAVRMEVLRPDGPVCSARIVPAAGEQLRIACSATVGIGSQVRLDGRDRMVLGEVVAVDRKGEEPELTISVEHLLLFSNMPEWLREGAAKVRTDFVSRGH